MMGGVIAFLLALQATLPIMTVARGTNSQIDAARQAVVQNETEWRALWRQHAGGATAPQVDFTRFTVVAVFAGTRATAGYSVDITAAATRDGSTTVDYVERQPASDAITAQVITAPFHIVRIPKATGRIDFRRVNP